MIAEVAARPGCPCGSGQPLAACCGMYLERRAEAPTAEALMRSRYVAFALRNAGYLLETWDPTQRPRRLELDGDRTEWLGLEILGSERGGEGDSEGRVEFIARFRSQGREQALHEHSRFRKVDGRWLYVDGEIKPERAASRGGPAVAKPSVGRNDPCPCGSGQKYKRCCGK